MDLLNSCIISRPYCALLLTHVWLSGTPWSVTHQAPLSLGILQARILKWVTMPSSREFPQARDGTQVSLGAGGFFTVWASGEVSPRLEQL